MVTVDVKSEIVDTIQSELGLRVNQFEGGHERTNLRYEVYPADLYGKNQVISIMGTVGFSLN